MSKFIGILVLGFLLQCGTKNNDSSPALTGSCEIDNEGLNLCYQPKESDPTFSTACVNAGNQWSKSRCSTDEYPVKCESSSELSLVEGKSQNAAYEYFYKAGTQLTETCESE